MNSIETNKEKWFEAEVNRVAGEIALKSPAPHTAKAEGYFERTLAIARQQQAKILGTPRCHQSPALVNISSRLRPVMSVAAVAAVVGNRLGDAAAMCANHGPSLLNRHQKMI
jgi:hypothetical protein